MLTVKQIEAARFGTSPVRISDGNGLYLRLNKGGGKTFQLRLTQGARTEWVTLGHYPDLSLRDARVKAVLVREGRRKPEFRAPPGALANAPDLPEPAGSGVPLFRDFATVWFDRKKQELLSGKHIAQNWTTLKAYVFP